MNCSSIPDIFVGGRNVKFGTFVPHNSLDSEQSQTRTITRLQLQTHNQEFSETVLNSHSQSFLN